jgi:hypothetical protein
MSDQHGGLRLSLTASLPAAAAVRAAGLGHARRTGLRSANGALPVRTGRAVVFVVLNFIKFSDLQPMHTWIVSLIDSSQLHVKR